MEFLRFLETLRNPVCDALFQVITVLGEETPYLVLTMLVLWCVNKRWGYFLLYTGLFGTVINQFLKLICCVPRPWLRDPSFTIVESAREGATGYSFPSGHSTNAAIVYLGLARSIRRRTAWIVCCIVAALIGLSRMYLGVHTPADVGVGLLTGICLVFACAPLFERGWENPRYFIGLAGTLIACAAGLVLYAELAPLPAGAVAEYSAHGLETGYKMLGACMGFAICLWLDQTKLHYPTDAVWWAQILKMAGGLALVVAIRLISKAPLLALTGGHPCANGIRYLLMILAGGAVWPLTFRWFSRLGRSNAANQAEKEMPAANQ